jgi:hypothetical protein
MKTLKFVIVLLSITTALTAQSQIPSRGESPATQLKPVEPNGAILEAFKTHPITALGNIEFSGNEQCHAFQLSLIRDPRFASAVNDIVVEFGNAKYQDVVDRFVRGEDVPYDSLRHIWQDTTQVEFIWDLPIYEDFFRAVRTVNASLPPNRHLRVLLGDPPIDWATVHSREDLDKFASQRDTYTVDVIRREVLAKKHHALLIFGTQHLLRKNTVLGAADEGARGIVGLLEKDGTAAVFTVMPEVRRDLIALQPDIASWPKPSLATVRGTVLGALLWDPNPQRRAVRVEDQIDAILYLGPSSSMTMSRLSPGLCADQKYMEMRTSRLGLIPPPPGAPFTPADQLKRYCADSAKQSTTTK